MDVDPKELLARRVKAANLVGLTSLALLGLLLVDMPQGIWGAADTLSSAAQITSAALGAAAVTLALLSLAGRRVTGGALLLYSAVGLVFIPAFSADLIIAGLLSLFALYRLVSTALGVSLSIAPQRLEAEPGLGSWQAYGSAPLQHLSLVALVSTVAVVGLELSEARHAALLCLGMHAIVLGASWRFWLLSVRQRRRSVLALALPVFAVVALSQGAFELALILMVGFQLILLIRLLILRSFSQDLINHFLRSPALLLFSTFALLISAGALALRFPAASAGDAPINSVDAIFLASSATSITGLSPINAATELSTFGHVILLFLIQTGGLGILVLSTFVVLMVSGHVGLLSERVLGESMDLRTPEAAIRLTRFIVLSTLTIELIAAVVLLPTFLGMGFSLPEASWHAVFHAVSGFCNAGLSTLEGGVADLVGSPIALMTIAGLVLLGSSGFVVLSSIWRRLVERDRARFSVHVKIVIAMTVVLNVASIFTFVLFEWQGSLAAFSGWERAYNAVFMGICSRTAGFSTIDTSSFAHPTALIFMFLMYIGGAPGGTAGGIKVTTFAVLVAAVPAIARGDTRVVMFRRTMEQSIVYRSAAIAVITLMIAFSASILLLATQEVDFRAVLFEAISGVGTVGLSIGATSALSVGGKLILSVVMFLGRTGPLTLAILLSDRGQRVVRYPRASIMVG